ncbi:hypothetical protein AOL_s00091g46 [Orbilia oligospora ATCC 24927]|uniref:Uncharacterized protein n=1 Tax=Arthrobotrys oligospora (strain ATCC 24927 / CBS 115.81 / DSM 1491) TaxID=756982 RepID=G1XHZ4_ARTOA|nr:hypothetical protein AOL_s00091g46 [Orbilia oligospora ATCC 24927]EGX47225.1 hypothetical protein AOL_s00091g46 [Orbilia oligospora ATCC 24927]
MSSSESSQHPPKVVDYRLGTATRKPTVKNVETAFQDSFWDWHKNSFRAVFSILKKECKVAIQELQRQGDLYINEISTYKDQSPYDRQLLYTQVRDQILADRAGAGPQKYHKYNDLLLQVLSCTNKDYLSLDEPGCGTDNWMIGICFDLRMQNDKRKKSTNPRSLAEEMLDERDSGIGYAEGSQGGALGGTRHSTIHEILNREGDIDHSHASSVTK